MVLNLGKGYNERFGQNISQMPVLLKQGEALASVSRVYYKRLDRTDNEVRENWLVNYFDTGDLMVYDNVQRSEKVKIVMTADNQGRLTEAGKNVLGLINTKAPLISRAVKLSDEQYDTIPGIELTINDFGVINTPLTRKQVLDSRLHRILARNPNEVPAEFAEDANLLPAYVSTMFRLGKSRHGYDAMMGIYLDAHEKSAKLRAWLVSRLEYRSDVDGGNALDDSLGRFVGLAPEAQVAQNLPVSNQRVKLTERKITSPTLEQVLTLGRGYIGPKAIKQYTEEARKLFGK
jgi:hypothetical protein